MLLKGYPMPGEEGSSSATSVRQSAEMPQKRFRKGAFIVVTIVASVGLGLASGGPEIVIFPLLGLLVLFVAWQWPKRLKEASAKHMTYEEFEREHAANQAVKKEMVAIAEEVYNGSPLGKWRYVEVHYPQYGIPTVLEERKLELSAVDGAYSFVVRNPPSAVRTTFRVRLGDKRAGKKTFQVQLTSPSVPGWHTVEYGFEAQQNDTGALDVALWMEGEDPLPQELEMHWPFQGTFFREKISPVEA
jgi:hypothetical protein